MNGQNELLIGASQIMQNGNQAGGCISLEKKVGIMEDHG